MLGVASNSSSESFVVPLGRASTRPRPILIAVIVPMSAPAGSASGAAAAIDPVTVGAGASSVASDCHSVLARASVQRLMTWLTAAAIVATKKKTSARPIATSTTTELKPMLPRFTRRSA